MTPEIRAFIGNSTICLTSVGELGPMLPPEDEVVDAWIAECIEEHDTMSCLMLMLAAMQAGRPVDARHLVRGGQFMQHPSLLGGIMWMMTGDVAAAAAAALTNSVMHGTLQGGALLAAVGWCREKGDGTFPPGLRFAARRLARNPGPDPDLIGKVLGAAVLMEDETVVALLFKAIKMPLQEQQKVRAEAGLRAGEWLEDCRGGPCAFLITAPTYKLVNKGVQPMRYSPTLGSKSPCHCGSGRKYKHCCLASDRTKQSAGGNVSVSATPDCDVARLNATTLARLDGTATARLDARLLPPALLPAYFERLYTWRLFRPAVRAFKAIGYRPELEEWWNLMTLIAARAGEKEIVEQMFELRGAHEPVDLTERATVCRLLLVRDDPAAYLATLEERALQVLTRGGDRNHFDLAVGLLYSATPALAIFVARGCLPLLPRVGAHQIFDSILHHRDRLQLPPEDDYADIFEKFFADDVADHGKDAAALREARRRLESKAGEVRQLKSRLDHMNHEVGRLEAARHEAAAAKPAPRVKPAAAPADENTLRELRRKMEEMKASLNERHEERTALRRELQQAQDALEKTRAATVPAATGDHHAEDAHLLPAEPLPLTQPLRLPEYPRGFYETLHCLPPATARHTVTTIARLATGEADAFTGVVRLKALPNVLRVRIGQDYRLLFRLHPERLEVVDLINRRDLEKRIRSLEAGS